MPSAHQGAEPARPSWMFRSPPGWPPPPRDWLPPPGWAPDPRWPMVPYGWQFFELKPPSRWALDNAVRTAAARAGRAWSPMVAWWPVVGLLGVFVVGGLVAAAAPQAVTGAWGAVATLVLYAVLVGSGVWAGARPARAGGGWGATFGVVRPRWLDGALGLGWAVGEFGARILVALILVLLIPSLQDADPANLDLDGVQGPELLLTGIAVVLVAPVVEEFLFRGLMLRTLMIRLSFWPAALISSVVFSIFHAPAVESLDGAVVLVLSIFVFAIGQCLLVRWRGTLGAAVVAHMVSNGVAFGVTYLLGS